MDQKPGQALGNHTVQPDRNHMLVGKDVSHSFQAARVLDGVSVSVDAGEAVALVGPSGSGKTTLLYCLAGLIQPDSGKVAFQGRTLADLGDDARSELRRSSFGFIFQSSELVPELTIAENIALPLELLKVPKAERQERVGTLLDRLGLTRQAGQRPARVSGGQAQRAAVARAVIHRPAVVFADEPTGALDSANGAVVIDLLWELAREQNSAVVLVTHDHALAQSADRTIALLDGAIQVQESIAPRGAKK
ncbi:ABC transporter ATP-binding protein [Kitasatospora sp. NPDC088783]|uniref:ABC transporter ATP-binding protein n=1 Tax=Kitasatospora sp. NPDC088783 TaxID=3364077 RepID=UPI00380D14B5